MPIKEKLRLAASVSVILLALRFCILPILGGLLRALLPFLFALAAAAAVLPLARRISGACRLRIEVVGVALTLLALSLLSLAAFFALRAVVLELGELFVYLSGERSPLPALAARLEEWLSHLGLSGWLREDGGNALLSSLGTLLSRIGGIVAGAIVRLPSLLFFLFTSAIAAVYLVLFLPRALEKLPPACRRVLVCARDAVSRGLVVYGRAYAILFFVTAALSLVALALLSVPYPLLVALALAFVDLLPVLGVGTVLIPWAVLSLLTGRGAFGLCLVLLWATVTVVRRILEDRLVGRGLGVHPLLMLLGICLGLHFFGPAGLLLGPAAVAAGLALYRRQSARSADGG